LLYANRTLIDWTGHADLAGLAAGGLAGLLGEGAAPASAGAGQALAIATQAGGAFPVHGEPSTLMWDGEPAAMLVLSRLERKGAEPSFQAAEAENRELKSILDTATDGVVVVARDGRIRGLSRSAEALFGYEARDVEGDPFIDLFAPESHRAALDYLDGLARNGVASILNDGREVIGR